MQPLNVLGIETARGFRTVELFHGDITALAFHADVLVVSAYAGSYAPVHGTLIEALQARLGIHVSSHARSPELDLRDALGIWVSAKLDASYKFDRILGVEMRGTPHPLAEALDNVFGGLMLLAAKGVPTQTVVLPLLGAGSQRLNPKEMASELVQRGKHYLDQAPATNRLVFVEIDRHRAQSVADAIDRTLGRHKVNLPHEELVRALRQDVIHKLHESETLFEPDCRAVRDNWLVLLQQKEIRAPEFGVNGRKVVELMLGRLGVPQQRLADRIRSLEKLGTVAPWICGYMNVLRHLGNEVAHSNSTDTDRQPAMIAPADLTAGLFCLERLLDFWQTYSARSLE